MTGGGAAGLSRAAAPERTPEPKRRVGTRVVLPVLLLGALITLLAVASRSALGSRRDVHVIPVVVRDAGTTATPGSAENSGTTVATAAGWIEPDPFVVHVSTLIDGVVAEMLVLDGVAVTQGDVIARLVADDAEIDVDAARAAVDAAQARVASAAARREAAETDWNEPVALTRAVDVGAAEVERLRASRRRAARAVEAAEGRLAQARDRLRRERGLVTSGAVSDAELVATALGVATLEAELATTAAEDDVLAAAEAAAVAAHVAARRALELRVDDRMVRDMALAAVAAADAELRSAQARLRTAALRLARTEIRAPVTGVVMRRHAEPGRRVMLNMDMETASWVVDLYDPAKLQVRVDVPLADAAHVGVGSRARVTVETLPDRTFAGEVTHVVHFADIQKNTVQFKVRIDAPDPALRPEMLARVEMLGRGSGAGGGSGTGGGSGGGGLRGSVFAPRELVGGGTAWTVGADGETAELRKVTLGSAMHDGWVEVRDGLHPGDRLVAEPPADLTPGEALRVVGEAAR